MCFYIPLTVMLLTYTLTVRLLAHQRQSLGGVGGVPKPTSSGLLSSGWLGIAPPLGTHIFHTILLLKKSFFHHTHLIFFHHSLIFIITKFIFYHLSCTRTTTKKTIDDIVCTERKNTWKRFVKSSLPSTPNHAHSAASTDTDLSTLEINTHELWLPESR